MGLSVLLNPLSKIYWSDSTECRYRHTLGLIYFQYGFTTGNMMRILVVWVTW